ncbi:S-layer homology domain-containing protein [Oscillospiraceae bacterium 50-58]
MKKRLFSLALALALCMGLTVPVLAIEPVVTSRPDTDTESKWPKSGQPETGLSLYTEIKTVMSTNGPWVPGIPSGQERPVGFICYGLKDSSGNIVLPANYSCLIYLGPDRLYVGAVDTAENGYAVIDFHGNIVVPYGRYEIKKIEVSPKVSVFSTSSGPWTDGYSTNIRMGLFDWNGNVIFKYGDYHTIYYGGDGYFIVTTNNKKTGVYEYGTGIVVPFQYRSMGYLNNNLFGAENPSTGLCGVVDKFGNQILPFEYEYIRAFRQGCFIVEDFINVNPEDHIALGVGVYSENYSSDYMTDALVDGYGKYLIPFGQFDSVYVDDSGYVHGGDWTGKYRTSLAGSSGGEGKIYNYTYRVKLTDLLAEKGGTALPYSFPSADTDSSAQTPIISNSSGAFTDVKSTDYYSDAVLWAVEKNITSGTSKTTFSPNNTCSNAEILTFLWRANGSPDPTATNPFTDVKTTDYFYKAALWATQKGLVSGSTFGANTDCTRAMTMEYMWKATGSPTPAGKADFTDVPANADYAQAVAWAVENKITSGTGGNNFSPAATCTRGQIVTFLYRAMGK